MKNKKLINNNFLQNIELPIFCFFLGLFLTFFTASHQLLNLKIFMIRLTYGSRRAIIMPGPHRFQEKENPIRFEFGDSNLALKETIKISKVPSPCFDKSSSILKQWKWFSLFHVNKTHKTHAGFYYKVGLFIVLQELLWATILPLNSFAPLHLPYPGMLEFYMKLLWPFFCLNIFTGFPIFGFWPLEFFKVFKSRNVFLNIWKLLIRSSFRVPLGHNHETENK